MMDKSKYDVVYTIILKEGGKHRLTEDTVKIELRETKTHPLEEMCPADVEKYRVDRKNRCLGDLDYDMWPSTKEELKKGLFIFECPNGWVFQEQPFRFDNKTLYRIVHADGSHIAAFEADGLESKADGAKVVEDDDKYDICVHKQSENEDWDIDPIIKNGSSSPFHRSTANK